MASGRNLSKVSAPITKKVKSYGSSGLRELFSRGVEEDQPLTRAATAT